MSEPPTFTAEGEIMRGIGSIRGLRGAMLVRGLVRGPVRYDGFAGFQGGGGAGGNNGSAGAVPVGGGGGPGTAPTPPPVPPPAPGPTPTPAGGQPGFGTAPSPGSPGQPAPGQPQPGTNPNLVPQPGPDQGVQGAGQGQPTNPLAALNQLPPQALAYVQQLARQAQEAERLRYYAQVGYQHLQGAGRPGQGQPQRPANPFGVPTFDLGNLSMLRRDPQTGQYVADPNAPPGLVQQAEAYQQALVQAQHTFFQDPLKALEPLIAEVAGKIADQRSQQQLGQYQQQQFAQQTLQANAGWMYEADAAGQPVMEWDVRTGQAKHKLSPWGQEYARRVFALSQHGIHDSRLQHQLAMDGLKTLAYEMRYQQAQGQTPAGQLPQNQGFAGGQPAALPAAGAVGQPGFNPGTPPGYGQQQPGNPPAPAPGMPGGPRRQSLREELSGVYAANGFTDQAIAQGVQAGFGAGYSGLGV